MKNKTIKPKGVVVLATGCCVLWSHAVFAQVVNGDFSGGNSGFTTGYSFVSSGQSTTPGSYGIRTNSQNFNPGYTLFGDHTTGDGNMMLADGAASASTIVWQETIPVTTNTNYLWSAWAAPANGGSPATLRFTINGAAVGSSLTLDGPPGFWQNFTALWSSGSATTATLALTDQNTVALGNDFALDDISFVATSASNALTQIYPAVEIYWNSLSGHNYQVQYATALNSNVWINFGPPVAGTGTNNSMFDSTRSQPAKFYRVLTL